MHIHMCTPKPHKHNPKSRSSCEVGVTLVRCTEWAEPWNSKDVVVCVPIALHPLAWSGGELREYSFFHHSKNQSSTFCLCLKALFSLSSQPLRWLIMTKIVLSPTHWERKIPYSERVEHLQLSLDCCYKAVVWNERLKQQLFIGCTIKHHHFALLNSKWTF